MSESSLWQLGYEDFIKGFIFNPPDNAWARAQYVEGWREASKEYEELSLIRKNIIN